MRDRSPGIGPRPALLAAAALIVLVVTARLHAQTDPDEVRAIWNLRTTLSSPSSIETLVDAAKGAGFDAMAEVIEWAHAALFSYDSLTGPSRGPEYLAQLGHAAFLQ